jgi:RNA polymerase sigma factor (TIGR02999 family)
MRRQSAGHTFQTTELIHEAYLKISGSGNHNFNDRAHFFGVAARAMRHILVDYARSKSSQKRGGWQERLTLDDSLGLGSSASNEIVRLNDAMNELATVDERKFKVVELKYFGGLTNEEIASVLNISPETVKRDWRFSRTWLLKELSAAPN